MIRATWHTLAKRELFDGIDFYESRVPGLGAFLLVEAEAAVQQIRRHPRSGPVVLGEVRRWSLSQFPYHVVYRIEERRIFILALAHQKRYPLYWAQRVR